MEHVITSYSIHYTKLYESLNIDNVQLTPGDNGLNISANFTKVSNYFSDKYGQHKVWVRFMLVQKQFEAPDGTVHRNVMVDMLPRITSYNVCYTKLLRRSFPFANCFQKSHG